MRALFSALLMALAASCPAHAQIAEPVGVDGGSVSGAAAQVEGIRVYRGIPFAAPPVGNLRWKPPQPVPSWEGVRKAEQFGPDCPQAASLPGVDGNARPQSEDCLYLNVWTGADTAQDRLPVMVWIHGGAFTGGSPAVPVYDGAALAKRGVVFVSISYRLGILGFLSHPELSAESPRHVSGNYGLLDQTAALSWVRRNIASFGGDPDRITIIGQSAGSMALSYLATSPLAVGSFSQVIGETGAAFGLLKPKPLAVAEERGLAFEMLAGASSLAELRQRDAASLVEAAKPMTDVFSGVLQPIEDGWAVPSDLGTIYRRGRQSDVPMLIGSNSDEYGIDPSQTLAGYRALLESRYGSAGDALFALHPATNDVEAREAAKQVGTIAMGDYVMYDWAGAQNETGRASVYLYRFTHHSPIPKAEYPGGPNAPDPGAWHGAEIVYAFDNLRARDWPWSDADRELSDRMASYWVNFARTGDPNGDGLPHWPTFREAPDEVMNLDVDAGPIQRPNQEVLEVLQRHFGDRGGGADDR